MSSPDLFSYDDAGPQAEDPRIFSVAEITGEIKDLLGSTFASVWVGGEISDFARPRSGHCYFTLKDEAAQLRSVIWRGTAAGVRFDLADGLEVLCQGYIDVYAPRGSYQLIVQHIEPKGIGALDLALRRLREKLSAEGLFDPARKRPLPPFPRRIAVVTSPTSAAVRDFLEVLRRRWRAVHVQVIPVRVQGEGAAAEIANAVRWVNQIEPGFDCLVVTRGGGSLEDLWAFNEEPVVRAIHASRVPVVSAVGHEIDVTLADLVADVRALTPSEAAERVVPAMPEVAAVLAGFQQRMSTALQTRALAARTRLTDLARRRVFSRPLDRVHDLARRLDQLSSRHDRAARFRLRSARAELEGRAAQLESLSPLAVLARGYSLTQRLENAGAIRSADALAPGELIQTRFAQGTAISRVEETS